MKRLTMDKAKTSEWVKLIDCDCENGVKVWLRLIWRKYYENEFEKSQGLGVQVFSLKNMKMFAQYLCQVWNQSVKRFRTQWGWMDGDGL